MDLNFCRASTADDTDVHVFYRNLFVFKMFCWLITPFSLVISSPVCCQGRADIFLIRKSPRIAWTCSLIVVPTNLTLIKEACGRLLTLQKYFWGMNEYQRDVACKLEKFRFHHGKKWRIQHPDFFPNLDSACDVLLNVPSGLEIFGTTVRISSCTLWLFNIAMV